ncbi:hypothetical protein AO468_06395 [Oenococcus oeni]|uniref:LysR family transcriptional regulator n=1 Tax=Oenococcus oeni TaxID=1247 RepID=UPI0008F81C78|nr:LysR family transcriptional regulator [Oenococcus oeni]OIK96811.1 hypothetical protein ATW86_10175 [Oenococcus oeni]PDH93248.1 hypothetical protein AO468_06395 [Oenococcus oeni]
MNIRQIDYFLVVSEELNYREASERLYISEPSLSIQIHNLERDLGCKLFMTKGRHIELTQAGHALIPKVKNIMSTVKETENMMLNFNNNVGTTIKVSTLGSYLIFPVLKKFQKEHENFSISLVESATGSNVTSLLNKQVDFSVLFIPIDNLNLNYHYLFSNRIVAVALKNQQFKDVSHMSLKEISKYPLIGLQNEHFIRQIIDRRFRQQQLEPDYRYLLTSQQKCANIARVTDCIGFITDSFFKNLQSLGIAENLKIISIDDPLSVQQNGLAYRNDIPMGDMTKALVSEIVDYYADRRK